MHISKILFIIIALFYYIPSHAQSLYYGRVVNIDNKNISIEYRDSDKSIFMVCTLKTGDCISKKKVKKLTNNLIEKNITTSPDGIWESTYTHGTFDIKSRTYTLINKQTGQQYTKTEETPYWDLVAEGVNVYDFAKDSSKLFYLSDRDGYMSIYEVNLKTTVIDISGKKLQISDGEVAQFYEMDNKLFVISNTKENPYDWSLYEYNTETGEIRKLNSYMKYDEIVRKYKNFLIFTETTSTGFSPILWDINKNKFIKFKNKIFSTKTYAKPKDREVEHIEQMSAVLLKPKTKSKNLLIWLHGGPYRQTSIRFHPFLGYGVYDNILEKIKESGTYVLKLDYRGSMGNGRINSESIKYNIGTGDVDDVVNAINFMKANYGIENIYLAGNSYGGYLSLKFIAEKPSMTNGVISIAGVTDWRSLIEGLPKSIFRTQFDGVPNTSNEKYYGNADILSKINNIPGGKVTIIHGLADRTIPKSQATLLYDAMKSIDNTPKIYLYKGEDHVILKQKNIKDMCKRIFEGMDMKKKEKAC